MRDQVILTQAEINSYREQLANMPEALEALRLLEANDGNLEGAFEMAVQSNPGAIEQFELEKNDGTIAQG